MDAEADADVRAPAPRGGLLVASSATGMFVTGFGWPGIIGELPFSGLLKDQLHLARATSTLFWAVATVAWYCKPLVGLVTDAYPLGGTRRRGYMLWGSVAAGLAWLAFALVPRAYLPAHGGDDRAQLRPGVRERRRRRAAGRDRPAPCARPGG